MSLQLCTVYIGSKIIILLQYTIINYSWKFSPRDNFHQFHHVLVCMGVFSFLSWCEFYCPVLKIQKTWWPFNITLAEVYSSVLHACIHARVGEIFVQQSFGYIIIMVMGPICHVLLNFVYTRCTSD